MSNLIKNKVFAMLLALVMVVGLFPVSAFAADDDFTVVVSMEGLTLGQGMYVEPQAYTLDEINNLLAVKGYGPYTEDTLTAAMATLAMLLDKGLEYDNTGSWESDVYLSKVKGIDKGTLNIPDVIPNNGGPSNEENDGNDDEWLGEFDYSFMSGWMITCNDFMIDVGCGQWLLKDGVTQGKCQNYGNTYVVRWQFTLYGYGADLGIDTGWGMPPYFTSANKGELYIAYALSSDAAAKAAALTVMEDLTATAEEVSTALAAFSTSSEPSGTAQDVSSVLSNTLAQLASTVTEPGFGTTGGEWSVLSLARGGYYAKNDAYFTDYYDRIVTVVNETAPTVTLANGALHKTKSTENSRLILALSSIGKDATSVGDWNLITPYEDFSWIKKQGINGPIFALIALDTHNYQTTDPTIRQQCIDFILGRALSAGGWALSGTTPDVDITAMTLQALANYSNQSAVAEAAEKAFTWLSTAQKENGGYVSWGSENAESIAQVITACVAWGINPDTDARFVKENGSVVDAILVFYDADKKMFCHVANDGGNAMATDQAAYALVAYDRLTKGQTSLYDMSDVTFETVTPVTPENPNVTKITATLGVPEKVEAGQNFNAVVSVDAWDSEAGYKLIDFVMSIPEGVTVDGVTVGDRVSGGEVSYNVDSDGKLRVVYFDANQNNNLALSGRDFLAELFSVVLKDNGTADNYAIAIGGMSFKTSSEDMIVVDTANAGGSVTVTAAVSYSAVELYTGDNVDIIPSTKKAVAVAVTGVSDQSKLSYNDGVNNINFLYSTEISEKTGVSSYVALVDAAISMENFINAEYYTLGENTGTITFGDANGDGVINAQDALAAVDTWLRKSDAPTGKEILALNVNGDSRINTFDALGIVEAFVNGTDYAIVTKAASLATAN